MTDISNSEDLIDIRDVIARFEELEGERKPFVAGCNMPGYMPDSTLDECQGNGGDHEWRGDWYPVTLIRDSYFRDYAQELAEDIGAINADATWPNNCIDWERAARELQMDYTSVEFDGVTYWVR